MITSPTSGWQLPAVLILLTSLAVGASKAGELRLGRPLAVAAVRALVQLAAVAGVLAVALRSVSTSLGFVALMLVTATLTSAGRIGSLRDWPWVGLALLGGVLPVLGLIFGLGAADFAGPVIVPVAGIIVGGAMTANTLAGRRAFDALRSERGTLEAALALGFRRFDAVMLVIRRSGPEALTPIREQTRTVGLVTLPGAFVGVILGGGSASQAAAAQVLVLVGLLAAETLVVVGCHALIAAGRIMPVDLLATLPDL